MRDELTALLIAVTGLIVSQITSFIRSQRNHKRIQETAARVKQSEADTAAFREKVDQDRDALINRVMAESLDRIDRLLQTLDKERVEHNTERAEWREDRIEWRKEREERDKQIAALEASYQSIKRELEATNRELEATRNELARVRQESDDRENVIRDQSKIIEAQEIKIRQHEETIFQLQLRVKSLEDLNAELERLRNEALAANAPAFPSAPSEAALKLKRVTDEIAPPSNIIQLPDSEPKKDA